MTSGQGRMPGGLEVQARMRGSSANCSMRAKGWYALRPISATSARVGKSGWCARICAIKYANAGCAHSMFTVKDSQACVLQRNTWFGMPTVIV